MHEFHVIVLIMWYPLSISWPVCYDFGSVTVQVVLGNILDLYLTTGTLGNKHEPQETLRW